MLRSAGVAYCLNAANGETIYQERVRSQAGGDRVHPDAVLGHVHRGAPRQRHDARFRRRVMGLTLLGPPADHTGVVNNDTASLGDHLA